MPFRQGNDSNRRVDPVEILQLRIALTQRQPDGLSFLLSALKLKKIIPLSRKEADSDCRCVYGHRPWKLLPEFRDGNGQVSIATFDGNSRRCMMTGF